MPYFPIPSFGSVLMPCLPRPWTRLLTGAAGLLLAWLVLALSGCAGLDRTATGSPEEGMSTQQLLLAADQAWRDGESQRSERYYQRILQRVDVAPAGRLLATRRLAESSFRAGRPQQALHFLQSWAQQDPRAGKDVSYLELRMSVLAELGQESELAAGAEHILSAPGLSWGDRARLGIFLGRVFLDHGRAADAADFWEQLYARAGSAGHRGELERQLDHGLAQVQDLDPLIRLAAPGTAEQFPFAVARFEQGRRMVAEGGGGVMQGAALMQDVLLRSNLTDKAFFGDILSSLGGDSGGMALRLVLAVPVTGKYAGIGQKIARGAGAAQWQLAGLGLDMEIRIINTAVEGWVDRLTALPGEWSLVGGPLTVEGFKDMARAGVLKRRAVFSFLPALGDAIEGRDAWRFFFSREDEVRALLDLCIHRLGITRFGVLAPEEAFGSRMRDIFTRLTMEEGGSIARSATYPPGEHTEWARRVARVLGVPSNVDKRIVVPAPPFGAVFLPDGWNQAQLLVPNFFYYDAADMVYLGPNLWSSSLDQVSNVELNYFRMAVCPGSWWPETPGAEALQAQLDAQGLGKADTWVALGYDFAHLASVLGPVPVAPSAAEINRRLSQVNSMTFALAPMRYSADGLVREQQYLFSPGSGGKRLADPDDLRKGIERARNLRENRRLQLQKTRP